jgi:hypothetical protein
MAAVANGFHIFCFGIPLPAAELERHGVACRTQIVGESFVDHGSRNDHSSDAQSGDSLRFHATRARFVHEAPFEDANHGTKDGFVSALGVSAAPGDVGGQRNHGAGVFYIVVMLARQVGMNDLRAHISGGEIDGHTFPAMLPLGIKEKRTQGLCVKRAFAAEIAVKAAGRQTPHRP